MHPIGNFATYDRSPELQVGKLSTISSTDSIFIHHVLLQGKGRHLLGSAMVRHTVPPCFTIYTSHRSVKRSISNLDIWRSCVSPFAALRVWLAGGRDPKLALLLIFLNKRETHKIGYSSLDKSKGLGYTLKCVHTASSYLD